MTFVLIATIPEGVDPVTYVTPHLQRYSSEQESLILGIPLRRTAQVTHQIPLSIGKTQCDR